MVQILMLISRLPDVIHQCFLLFKTWGVCTEQPTYKALRCTWISTVFSVAGTLWWVLLIMRHSSGLDAWIYFLRKCESFTWSYTYSPCYNGDTLNNELCLVFQVLGPKAVSSQWTHCLLGTGDWANFHRVTFSVTPIFSSLQNNFTMSCVRDSVSLRKPVHSAFYISTCCVVSY